MSRPIPIPKFANSLTEFLIDALADKYGDAKHYAYRYNNLKVQMDPSRISEPHFCVCIGISEAYFAIESGKKIEGALGYEDNFVQRWAGRANIYNELKMNWKAIKEAIAAAEEEEMSKKTAALATLEKAKSEGDRIRVDITGTGIDRTKRIERNKRLKEFKKRENQILRSKKKNLRKAMYENAK